MKSELNLDQTQFVAETPLLESEGEDLDSEMDLETKKPPSKSIKIVLVVVLLLLALILGLIVLVKTRQVKKDDQATQEAEVELRASTAGPYNQRLLELKNELEVADPSQEDLPFPPVNTSISLDK